MSLRAFPEQVSPRILSPESFDYFGTSEYFSGWKKKKNLTVISKTSMMRQSKPSFYESCDEHAVYFRQWLKFITFLYLAMM